MHKNRERQKIEQDSTICLQAASEESQHLINVKSTLDQCKIQCNWN